MKIAIVAPIVERIPPRKYGGTERVIHELTKELVSRGHDVTLFATGDSITKATLSSVVPKSLRELAYKDIYGSNPMTLLHVSSAYERQDEFDIIHDHTAPFSLPIANLSKTPVVITLHGAFSIEDRALYETLNNPYFVTISKAQAVPVPSLKYVGTVYHGLTMDMYPFSQTNEGYLLFVGRIAEQKGVHHAITVAEYLNLPLIIAAKIDKEDQAYFKKNIEPRLTDRIRWIGEVSEPERNNLMSNALCFLHPVTWREPFGLTLIEAMATGCPVVAFGRGSIPEIIEDGKTGFVVEDAVEMVEAVKHVDSINRQYCRESALSYFNPKRMTDDYEHIYSQIVTGKVTMIPDNGNGSRFSYVRKSIHKYHSTIS